MRWLGCILIAALFALPVECAKKDVTRPDGILYDEVRRKLANDPDVQGAGFVVEVHDGAVTIKGIVEKEKWKAKAERLAKKVKGVTSVDNQLKVGSRAEALK